jgi:hypothetical protein
MLLFLALAHAIKKKEEILDLDQHRFRKIVFHRDMLQVWVSGMSSPDFAGHSQTMTVLDDAFALGKGFLKFAYLDVVKNTHIPRRLELSKQPHFCFFHPGGHECLPAQGLSARDVVNRASAYLPDFTENATRKWLDMHEQSPAAILFTEREQTPVLWVAIATAFRGTALRIGISRDREFAKTLNVTKLPTILLHNFSHSLVYEGDNEYLSMKTNLKKFMMKRLARVRAAVKVKPLKDYGSACKGADRICVIHAVGAAEPEFEALRLKYKTTLFEFFFGTGGEQPAGSVMVNWPGRNRNIAVANLSALDGVLAQIVEGTAAWTELAVAEEDNSTPGGDEIDDSL